MIVFQKIFRIPIIKNLGILMTGTILAQMLAMGFQVILRRMYSPEDFGAFAVYMSMIGILATWSSLRYEQVIVLPKEDAKGDSLLGLSLILSVLFSLFIGAICWFFSHQVLVWTGLAPEYHHWIYWLPLSLFLFGTYQALNFYLIRLKWFSLSANNKVVRRGTEGVIQTALGIFHFPIGLLLGDIFGQLSNIIHAGYRIFTTGKWPQVFSFTRMKEAAHTYKSFPVKNGIPSMLNALSLLLPVLFINRLFDTQTTGYFDLARMVLILPLALITTSLSQVLLQRFTEKKNHNTSIKKEAIGVFISLTLFSLAFGLLIFFLGEFLFGFIFGKSWEIAGLYSKILVWAFALKFIISPFNILFTAFEKIGILFIWQILDFIMILFLSWIPFHSIEAFLKAYVWIELTSYGLVAILDFGLIYTYEKQLNRKNYS